MRLSDRMSAVAAMVTAGGVLADVGTDHGYVPIALVERGVVARAIAMDLREGPLARAAENIARCGLSDWIGTRLSDGVAALAPGEADSIVIAGMGGELVVHILSEGEAVCRASRELILQPQSEIRRVRTFLREQEYTVVGEAMVCEDDKYYTVVKAVPGKPGDAACCGGYAGELPGVDVCDRYGACLLGERNRVLLEFLRKEERTLSGIAEKLAGQPQSDVIRARLAEIEKKMSDNRLAREFVLEEGTYEGIRDYSDGKRRE